MTCTHAALGWDPFDVVDAPGGRCDAVAGLIRWFDSSLHPGSGTNRNWHHVGGPCVDHLKIDQFHRRYQTTGDHVQTELSHNNCTELIRITAIAFPTVSGRQISRVVSTLDSGGRL